MQTPSVVPASTENSTGHKIFYGLFGTILVIVYLMTFWVFLNGAALITGGGRANATVTRVEDAATAAGTPGAVSTSPANATNFSVKTSENANQYTFNFKTEDGQSVEKAYVSTALDVIEVGTQVPIIYNRNDPEDFIMDGFLPVLIHIGKNCLLFVTLTIAIIVCLVRIKILQRRAAAH